MKQPAYDLAVLQLLHLADSALPIGSLAHSFGLESLVAANLLTVADLSEFFRGFLEEAGLLEAVFCRVGFRLAPGANDPDTLESFRRPWIELNDRMSAMKPARESRAGSASLGKNFLTAVSALGEFMVIRGALQISEEPGGLIHHSVAFGLAGGVLQFDEDRTVMAYLHQCAASMVSACQRLLPLGQRAATKILWELKPAIVETAKRSATCSIDDAACFMPLLEWGAMEHPGLNTRLFVS